ncbi:hypothetical protein RI129_004031 [Pyrocoelia pectoralis]|uniref:Centrosomal and chromosomal factor n=1 Tax=Pyrocoelia pectoralis TaxID=417401 RepID=A0AAN7VSJ1_9COLE
MLGTSISFPHCSEELPAHCNQVQKRQSSTELRSVSTAMATCYPSYELSTPTSRTVQVPVQKDYSRPLHVDCSVEYELPNQAKPPQGVRNEPLLMIHPCYFRKIESQRRSPFVNNLPQATRQPSATKRRVVRTQQQQIPQQAAQYPIQYATTVTAATERHHQQQQQQQPPQQQQQQHILHHHHHQQQLWEPMPPLVPISAAAAVQQSYCKRDAAAAAMVSGCATYSSGSGDSGHWTDPDRSPDRPEDKHILSGKYRQYLRAHRLHPYVSSAIPIASTFPQIQQVCYNV